MARQAATSSSASASARARARAARSASGSPHSASRHRVEREAQVHRGRARRQQLRARARRAPRRDGSSSVWSQSAVGGGHPDQRRAAHLHVRIACAASARAGQPLRGEDVRQPRLVDDPDRAPVVARPDRAQGPAVDAHRLGGRLESRPTRSEAKPCEGRKPEREREASAKARHGYSPSNSQSACGPRRRARAAVGCRRARAGPR